MNYLKVSNLILVLIFPVILFAQNTGKPYEIDLYGSMNQYKEFYLSEVAEDVEYVKLENHPDGMIAYANIIRAGEFFVVSDWRKPIMIFVTTGEFIRTIGSFGQGPQEYTRAYRCQVDQINQWIYILHREKRMILKFSINGDFLGDIKLEHRSSNFCLLPDQRLLVSTNSNYQDDIFYPLCILGPEGQMEHQIQGHNQLLGAKSSTSFTPGFNPIINGDVILANFVGDIVYKVDLDGHMIPFAEFELGKYKLPHKYLEGGKGFRFSELSKDYIISVGCSEIGNFLKISYSLNHESHSGFFDKESN